MAKVKYVKKPEEIELIEWDGTLPLPEELQDHPQVKVLKENGVNRLVVTSEVSQVIANAGDYLEPSAIGFKVHPRNELSAKYTKKV